MGAHIGAPLRQFGLDCEERHLYPPLMANIWNSWGRDHYLGLYPWTWTQLESAELPGPFPFFGGVDPEVVASLQEAHHLMQSAIDTAISDVFAHRGPLDDPERRRRLEDAYAELVRSPPASDVGTQMRSATGRHVPVGVS